MRFSAAIQSPLPLRTPAAADFLRRLVTGKPAPAQAPQAAQVRVEDLPADLDQRVRLVGEW